jgi:hypothetical protein
VSTSSEDIEREHDAAMRSLTPEQYRGLARERRARALTNFNGLYWRDNLQTIFDEEAQARREAEAEATASAA